MCGRGLTASCGCASRVTGEGGGEERQAGSQRWPSHRPKQSGRSVSVGMSLSVHRKNVLAEAHHRLQPEKSAGSLALKEVRDERAVYAGMDDIRGIPRTIGPERSGTAALWCNLS